MAPYSQLFEGYNLMNSIDGRDNIPAGGLQSADYSLQNCSISEMLLGQWISSPGLTQVRPT
jgi:hypothetical protein